MHLLLGRGGRLHRGLPSPASTSTEVRDPPPATPPDTRITVIQTRLGFNLYLYLELPF